MLLPFERIVFKKNRERFRNFITKLGFIRIFWSKKKDWFVKIKIFTEILCQSPSSMSVFIRQSIPFFSCQTKFEKLPSKMGKMFCHIQKKSLQIVIGKAENMSKFFNLLISNYWLLFDACVFLFINDHQ